MWLYNEQYYKQKIKSAAYVIEGHQAWGGWYIAFYRGSWGLVGRGGSGDFILNS